MLLKVAYKAIFLSFHLRYRQ